MIHLIFWQILRGDHVQAVSSSVAEEMGVKLGEEVGYTIRFEDLTKNVRHLVTFLISQ